MRASVGDRIVTASGVVGGAVRDGTVVEVRHDDGSPPYLVEWADTGERTLVYPGSDSLVRQEVTVGGPEADAGAPGHAKMWHIQVSVVESGGRTVAEAVLVSDSDEPLRAVGKTRKDPGDAEIPEIGDHVAAARALQRLADRLLGMAEHDISDSTGEPAHVHR